MLELKDVHTYYGDSYVLQGVSLKVEPGSVVALLGRNGMGKTTTVHTAIGFTPARRGKVLFKGRDVTHLPPNEISRMGIALVPQGRRIFASLSVKENLTMAARGAKQGGWTIERVHDLFPVLKVRANLRGTSLSGGEQQMLALARVLMTNPELILMDEPTEGLAPMLVRQLRKTIKELQGAGLSVLLVEQNLAMALSVADYVYVLNQGAVVHESGPAQLASNEEVKTKYLGVSTGR